MGSAEGRVTDLAAWADAAARDAAASGKPSIIPTPKQARFLSCTARECGYGGAAGGGKSFASIIHPLRWVHNPNFRALYLRRESKYLGDAIDKSRKLYTHVGGTFVQSPKMVWTFPSGATIWMSHCEHEKDIANYDSYEFNVVIFEELTHFTERMYTEIAARIRSTDRTLPLQLRSTFNPGGPGHDWVFARFAAWLDPKHARPAKPGEVRHYVGNEEASAPSERSLSRTFIGARLSDNPHIGPEYRAQLAQLDAVRRAQLEDGDWLIRPAAGLLFKRAWWADASMVLDSPPYVGRFIRYWDRAATEPSETNRDPDWTVGAKWCLEPDGRYVVCDVIRLRGRPAAVEAAIVAAAVLDGSHVEQVLEQDPGQAGVADVDNLVAALAKAARVGRAIRPTGKKDVRAGPASALCERRMVRIVRGLWNDVWLAMHEAFPTPGVHDDDVDTTSGAVAYLTGNIPPTMDDADTFRRIVGNGGTAYAGERDDGGLGDSGGNGYNGW